MTVVQRSEFTPFIEYSAFLVCVTGDPEPDIMVEVADLHDGVPPTSVYFNRNGIYCTSVASNFYAFLALEVHDREPPVTEGGWQEMGRGLLDVTSGGLRVEELTGGGSGEPMSVTPGSYAAAVWCRERRAPSAPLLPDGTFPTGPESWLIQLWPA